MTGQELIDFIEALHLEDSPVVMETGGVVTGNINAVRKDGAILIYQEEEDSEEGL